MGQISSTGRWRNLENGPPEEQKRFFSQFEKQFVREPVSATNRNVKKADHLMVYRQGYTHHLICIGVKGDTITVMEYGMRNLFEIEGKEALKLLLDLENLGEVHQKPFTFEELEKMNMRKIVWPKKLKRFSAKKVVKRAKSLRGERRYNCLTNNCEHFVVWCMCGLKVSFQVKMWYYWVKEMMRASCAGARVPITQALSNQLGSFLLKVLANASDEIAGQFLKEQCFAFGVGFAIASIIEAGLCYVEIKQAFDDRDSGVIPSDEELNTRILEIVAKAIFRLGLGAAGSLVGSAVGPLGSLAGGIIGGAVGHYLGGVLARWYRPTQAGNNS